MTEHDIPAGNVKRFALAGAVGVVVLAAVVVFAIRNPSPPSDDADPQPNLDDAGETVVANLDERPTTTSTPKDTPAKPQSKATAVPAIEPIVPPVVRKSPKKDAPTVKSEPEKRPAGAVEKSDEKAVEKADPKTVEKTEPKTVEKTDPKTEKTEPKTVEKTEPKTVEKTEPKAVEKAPPVVQVPPLKVPVPTEQPLNARLNAAVEKAKDYLFGLQRNTVYILERGKPVEVEAEWKDVVVNPQAASVKVKGRGFEQVSVVLPPGWFQGEENGNPGGHSALITLALLAAGADPSKDARMRRAVESQLYLWVRSPVPGAPLQAGPTGTYSIGLRAQCLETALRRVGNGALHVPLVKALSRDAQALLGSYSAEGGYSYTAGRRTSGRGGWDMSNSQYGVLGLWAAALVPEAEHDDRVWELFNKFYLDVQSADGGWGYSGRGDSYPEMTAAGLASLFLVMDFVHSRTRGAAGPEITPFDTRPMFGRTVAGIERGLQNFDRNLGAPKHGYLRYGLERVGTASGYKYLGGRDWFRDGAEDLLITQNADGSWTMAGGVGIGVHGNTIARETAWDLLFLVHGSAPVLLNKLQFGAAADRQWNNYPRDAANLARWFGRTYEQEVNWQIVGLKKEEDLADAPLLYINGFKAPTFSNDDVDKLRRFVNAGGTLLCATDGGKRPGKPFIDGITELGKRLFPPDQYPEYRMTTVPKDHPVYALGVVGGAPGAADGSLQKVEIRHMHNGLRSFLFLVVDDVGHLWHGNRAKQFPHAFSLAGNVKRYALDHGSLPPKGRVAATAGADLPAKVGNLKLGVVQFGGKGEVSVDSTPGGPDKEPVRVLADWTAVPNAWRSYAEWFRYATGYELQERRRVRLSDANLAEFDVLHMSGQYAVELSAEEKDGLRAYLAGGGTLLVDHVGGRNATRTNGFFASMCGLLSELMPEAGLRTLPRDHALLTGKLPRRAGFDCTRPEYSRTTTLQGTGTMREIRALTIGDRPAAVLIPYDLSCALAEQTCWEREGYSTATARKLAANILVFAKESAVAVAR